MKIIATTGIWKISSNLKQVLDYTTDKEKTIINDDYIELHKIINYVEDDLKTESKLYVTGINCDPSTAFDEMKLTKERFDKTKGILGYHAFQSFESGTVSPEECHNIGIRLAEEMWGDRFEVIVSTHTNTDNYHNHFVINSVSFIDGKKYYDNHSTYAELRNISDSICKEYELNILKEKKCKNGLDYRNFQNKNFNTDNYYSIAKKDVDLAISKAYNYLDFINLLKNMNYMVINRSGKLSIRGSSYKRNIRIQRYFGESYSIDNIKQRIYEQNKSRFKDFNNKNDKEYDIFKNFQKTGKYRGLLGMYVHYLYLLKMYKENRTNTKYSASMRLDIEKMDEISKETRLIAKYDIGEKEEFNKIYTDKNILFNELKNTRELLWRRHKVSEDKETVLKQIEIINKQINPLKEELDLFKSIKERQVQIEHNLNEREEVINNEHIR